MTARASEEEVKALIAARAEARCRGDWDHADDIREKLDGWGYSVQDACDGTSTFIDISDELNARIATERVRIDSILSRARHAGKGKSVKEDIAALLRRAAKKDDLPRLKMTLRAALESLSKSSMQLPDTRNADGNITARDLLIIGNVNGKTALHFGAQNAGPNMLRFLLNNGADVHSHCVRGQTPLCFAIAKRRYRNVEVLLEAGSSLLVRTVLGETPLDLARAHIALPRQDLVLRLEKQFHEEVERKMQSLAMDAKDSSKVHPCGGMWAMWRDFTRDERAILNQLQHARTCENCKSNALALMRGEHAPVTSSLSSKRRQRWHTDPYGNEASDDDKNVGEGSLAWSSDRPELLQALSADAAVADAHNAKADFAQSHGKVRKAASEPHKTDALKILLEEGKAQWGSDHQNYIDLVESPSPGSGRTALMMAAWRGHIENVKLLLNEGASIDRYTKRSGNHGKTPIFYACTRCRDEVVRLLLSRGADVLIVNNKGQSVRSLAVSHLKEETTKEVERIEAEQLFEGRKWRNFRQSHSDGVAYGDLDVRFLDADNLRGRGGWDLVGNDAREVSKGRGESQMEGYGPQDPATGISRRWEEDWDKLPKGPGKSFPFPPPAKAEVCVRPTMRYLKRRPFESGEKAPHETRLKHAVHIADGLSAVPSDIKDRATEKHCRDAEVLPWVLRWIEEERKSAAALKQSGGEDRQSNGRDSARRWSESLDKLLLPLARALARETHKDGDHRSSKQIENENGNEKKGQDIHDSYSTLADAIALQLALRIKMDLGDNTKSKEAYAKIKTEVKDFVLAAMEECLNTEQWSLSSLLCSLASASSMERLQGVYSELRQMHTQLQDQKPKPKGSRRRTRKESAKKSLRRLQRVIEKLIMQAMTDIFSHMKIVAKLSMSDIEEFGSTSHREVLVEWFAKGTLTTADLISEARLSSDLATAIERKRTGKPAEISPSPSTEQHCRKSKYTVLPATEVGIAEVLGRESATVLRALDLVQSNKEAGGGRRVLHPESSIQ